MRTLIMLFVLMPALLLGGNKSIKKNRLTLADKNILLYSQIYPNKKNPKTFIAYTPGEKIILPISLLPSINLKFKKKKGKRGYEYKDVKILALGTDKVKFKFKNVNKNFTRTKKIADIEDEGMRDFLGYKKDQKKLKELARMDPLDFINNEIKNNPDDFIKLINRFCIFTSKSKEIIQPFFKILAFAEYSLYMAKDEEPYNKVRFARKLFKEAIAYPKNDSVINERVLAKRIEQAAQQQSLLHIKRGEFIYAHDLITNRIEGYENSPSNQKILDAIRPHVAMEKLNDRVAAAELAQARQKDAMRKIASIQKEINEFQSEQSEAVKERSKMNKYNSTEMQREMQNSEIDRAKGNINQKQNEIDIELQKLGVKVY